MSKVTPFLMFNDQLEVAVLEKAYDNAQ